MDFILTPSLEHAALVKIAATLWNQDDVRALVGKFYFISERQSWQVVEDKVIEKVPKLLLPEPLKKKILTFIKPIGWEILKWKEYHNKNFYLGMDLPNEFCWTPQGTVDKKKTTEALIKEENRDITQRYKLACIYCLEDDVRELWSSMLQREKAAFYSEDHPSFSQDHKLVVLWTYDIKGEAAKLNGLTKEIKGRQMSPYQFAFECSAAEGNKEATEYFLQKLTPREREESLVASTGYVALRRCGFAWNRTDFPKEHYADALCFLLSQMDQEQQMKVFEIYPYEVLKCFLDWPYQSLFMETANRLWDFLSEENCCYFLEEMADRVMEGRTDYDYQKLFEEFWQKIPDDNKRHIIGDCASIFLLPKLFKIKDEKNIKLILKDATLREKKNLIFCDWGQVICQDLICSDKWYLLKFFVGECISSRNEIIEFKEEFIERTTWCCSKEEFARNKDRWNKFFQLLDDFICGYDKRKSIEGNGSSSKRLL